MLQKGHLIKIGKGTYLAGRKLKPLFLAFLVLRDFALRPFLSVRRRPAPDLNSVRQVAMCVPDHLGDLLMVVPALRLFRTLAPRAELTLVVGEWTQDLALFLKTNGIVDDVVVCNLALLDRSNRSLFAKFMREWKTRASAIPILREKKIDLIFDMRSFSPNAWSMAVSSRARFRLGFGLRGMAFIYHQLMEFDFEKPTGQLFLDAIGALGGASVLYGGPTLPSAGAASTKILPVRSPYIVIQLYSAETERNAPPDFWREIITRLQGRYELVLIGSEMDGQKAVADGLHLPEVSALFGQTTTPELLRLVEESLGVLSVDSFSAHVGLAYEKRVAVLTVEGFTNKRSYPANNPLLAFFSSSTGAVDDVAEFFASKN